jgi:lambda family phage portal protein
MDIRANGTNTPPNYELTAAMPAVARSESAPTPRSDSGGYRLGRLDNATRRNVPGRRSGNQQVLERGELMHARTRDSYLNNPLSKRSVDVTRDLVVGAGIQAYADPIDHSFGWDLRRRPDSDLVDSLDYALESDESFAEWANDPAQCDVAGKLSFAEMQGMTITENCIVGQTLLIETTRRVPGGRVPLQYQVIESEQIDTSKDRADGQGGQNRIVGGFEFDRYGRELGVYVYDAHPYDTSVNWSPGRSTFIPRERYLHPFRMTRPSQGIGASWHHAQGQPMIDRDKWFEAELRSAVKAALFVLQANLKNPGSGNGLGIEDDLYDMSTGQIALGTSPIAAEMGLGEDIKIIESTRPNPNAQPFFNMLDHDLAAASNLSYYSLTGKFHEANFGGFKGALMLESAQMQVIAEWLGRAVVLPVRRRWNQMAAAAGVFRTMSARQLAAEQSRFNRYDIIGAGRFLIDADNETKADAAEMRGGFTTLKIECAARSLHWIKVLRQIALENRLCDVLGVKLDHSGGGGGGAGENGNSRTATRNTGNGDNTNSIRGMSFFGR